MTDQFGRPYDLDQSGRGFHKARSYLGPSLGWVETQILPERKINAAGTYDIEPGDSVILLEGGLPSTFHLPDAREWVRQNATQPATGFTRGIWIKDYGGNSLSQHVTIVPFGQQTIDGLNQSFILAQNFGIIALFPLVDATGWWLAPMTYDTGTGGTTAINPTAPIAGNVVGNVMNVAMLFDPDAFRVNAGNQLTFEVCDPGFVLGNPTVGTDTPIYTSLSSMLDRAIGSTQGQIMIRNNVGWTALNPGTVNQVLNSGGPGSNPFWGVPLQGSFLPITGGTLTGDLTISKVQPVMNFDFAVGSAALFASRALPSLNYRWQFIIADGSPETGSNVGSNFRIDRYADDGSYLSTPMTITRDTGSVILREVVLIGTPALSLQSEGIESSLIISQRLPSGFVRWMLALGDGGEETGGNVANNFQLVRFADDGTNLGTIMTGIRATGQVFIPGLQNFQPLDADLTALANLSGTNTIYYRSGANAWSPVTIGANMAFTGGVLSSSGGGGGSLVVGASTISNGVTTRILFNSGGILGEYDAANATGFLNVFTASLKGLVPLSGGGTVNYLRADGTWAPPPATGGIVEPVGDGFWGRNMLSGLGTWEEAVKKAGDTMTGSLVIAKENPVLQLDATGVGDSAIIQFRNDGLNRWILRIGEAETGANTGSNYLLESYNDGGAIIGTPFRIERSNGAATFSGDLTVAKSLPSIFVDATGATDPANFGFKNNGVFRWLIRMVGGSESGGNVGSDLVVQSYDDSGTLLLNALSFVRSTGRLTVAGDPTEAMGIATKQYVDSTGIPEPPDDGILYGRRTITGTSGWLRAAAISLTNTFTAASNFHTGQVIIGHTAILPGSGATKLQIASAGSEHIMAVSYQTGTGGPAIVLGKSKNAMVGGMTAVGDGDTLGSINWAGVSPSGALATACALVGSVQGTPSGSIVPGGFGMNVVPAGGSQKRSITFNSNQSIVIGPMPFALSGGIFEINNESAMALNSIFWNKWSNDAIGFELNLRKSRGLTSNIFTDVQSGDVLGRINFGGAGGGTWAGSYPSITAYHTSGALATGINSMLEFRVSDGSSFITVANFRHASAGGVEILGTSIANNAPAGFVGELVSSSAWSGTVIGANTPAQNLGSISLAAGDWDVWVNAAGSAGASATSAMLGLSTSSGVMPSTPVLGQGPAVTLTANQASAMTFCMRFSLATTSTVYLVAQTAAGGAVTFVGVIFARRRR